MKPWLACVLVLATSGCPSVTTDPGEGATGPTVEFDPAHSAIPFPNNLALDPATGKVNLPKQACESPTAGAVRTKVLNTLDGFGTYESAIQITLSEAADAASAQSSVVLYKRASGMTAVDPASAQPVPIKVFTTKTLRFDDASCASPTQVDALTIVPLQPLEQHSTYTVAVLSGIKTASGSDFGPNFTWSLVRQADDPVTLDDQGNVLSDRTPLDPNNAADLAQLQGLDLLWKAHAKALAFLAGTSHDRATILVAADFNTQTTTDPLDPAVANTPAASLASTPLLNPGLAPGVISVAELRGAPCSAGQGCTNFLNAAVPGICNSLPCQAVGDILAAALVTQSYQVLGANPLPGGRMIPGPWSDPVHPGTPSNVVVTAFAMIPNGTAPATGWPVVIFGHGLGSSKESLVAIGPQLAAQGFASIAIDFQAHGDRAIPEDNMAAHGCAGACSVTTSQACDVATACPTGEACLNGLMQPISPTTTQQCYAPFLSTDLATTRDNIRQTVLDLQRLIKAVTACGASSCPSQNNTSVFSVDPNHIVYAGISLGGIIGSTTTSVAPGIKAAVLNVPGVGLVDILENTETLEIRCTLVNSLIDAGILMGQKWDPTMPTVGLCTTDAWKDPATQPGYAQFRGIARWVLDPADGANFTPKLATKRFLIQEVVGDKVVPNVATDAEGMLVGLTPQTADPATSVPPPPSAAITTMAMTNKWVRYPTLPASGMFPGNAFEHASLLRPAASTPAAAGQLGTLRLQSDAITYLKVNQ